jgi:hypothetical protein
VLPCGCDSLAVNGNTPEPLLALVCLHLNTAQLALLVLDVEIKVLRVMTTRITLPTLLSSFPECHRHVLIPRASAAITGET